MIKNSLKKFVIEAQSVANLNNQNIVKIYDVGQHIEDGKSLTILLWNILTVRL